MIKTFSPGASSVTFFSTKFHWRKLKGKSRIISSTNRKRFPGAPNVKESIGRAPIRTICKKRWKNCLVDFVLLVCLVCWVNKRDQTNLRTRKTRDAHHQWNIQGAKISNAEEPLSPPHL